MKKKEEKQFEREIMRSGYVSNALGLVIFMLYAFFFAHIYTLKPILPVLILSAVAVYAIFQFCMGIFSNANSAHRVSKKIYEWKVKDYSIDKRTKLLKELHQVPVSVGISVFVMFILAIFLWILLVFLVTVLNKCRFADFSMKGTDFLYYAAGGIFAAYFASTTGVLRAKKVCSSYATKLVAQGIDDSEFDTGYLHRYSWIQALLAYFIIPLILIFISNFFIFYNEFDAAKTPGGITRIVILNVLNISLLILFSVVIIRDNYNFTFNVEKLLKDNIEKSSYSNIPTDLASEQAYVSYLMNKNQKVLQDILKNAVSAGKNITNSVNDLVEISTENATSSIQQSASVQQIVSSMEYADSVSKTVSSMINSVVEITNQNFNCVENGFSTLNENRSKMNAISDANLETINGIKNLSEQINGIWDIVNIISNIAEQTKIIAFNAELEASSAGEYGKNFHIVANEIRRLAESVSESTNEIKTGIFNIQHSSDELIVSSKGGTLKINEGLKLAEDLDKSFEKLKSSSTEIQVSAGQMNSMVETQISSFDQILETLRQISASIDENTHSSNSINDYAIKLQSVVDMLYGLRKFSSGNEN